MSGPLIPYLQIPEIPLAFLRHLPLLGDLIDPKHPPSIKPFGTLVALGVYFGAMVTMKRAKERGHDPKVVSDYLFWTVATGFVLSHVFDAISYHPETVLRDPLYLLKIWDGLSSMGGFFGAVLGSIAWKFYHRKPILGMVEITGSAMPLAWVFGRAGCSVVHDHPGILSDAWFAVRYPVRGGGWVGRLDLGLIEMVLTIPLAVAIHLLWRRRPVRPDGYYLALISISYAPVRFLLDFLRVPPTETALGADERYLSLTPAQWASFLMLAIGLYFLYRIRGQQPSAAPVPALAPAGAPAPSAEAPAEGQAAEELSAPATDAPAEPEAEPPSPGSETKNESEDPTSG